MKLLELCQRNLKYYYDLLDPIYNVCFEKLKQFDCNGANDNRKEQVDIWKRICNDLEYWVDNDWFDDATRDKHLHQISSNILLFHETYGGLNNIEVPEITEDRNPNWNRKRSAKKIYVTASRK